MDVRFNQGRVLINPFKETDDIDPETKKFGIRTHNKLIGFLLRLIGKADQVEGYDTAKNKTVIFYINTNSAVRWLRRHGLPEVDPFKDPGHAPDIKEALTTFFEIRELSKKIENDPKDTESLILLGKIFQQHQNWDAAIENYTKALSSPLEGIKKTKCLFYRAECFMSKFKLKNDSDALEKATEDYQRLKEIAPNKQSPDSMQTPSEHLEDIQGLKSK